MAVTIDLPPAVEAHAKEAQRRSLPLGQFLREYLVERSPRAHNEEAARRMRQTLDEVAALVGPNVPPIPAEALRRENLYGDDER